MIPINQIIQLATAAAQAVPQIIALVQAAKVGASETDLAKLEAAEALLAGSNDLAHQRIQSST